MHLFLAHVPSLRGMVLDSGEFVRPRGTGTSAAIRHGLLAIATRGFREIKPQIPNLSLAGSLQLFANRSYLVREILEVIDASS